MKPDEVESLKVCSHTKKTNKIYQNDISPYYSNVFPLALDIKVFGTKKIGFVKLALLFFVRSKTRDNINAKIKAYIKMKQHGWDMFQSINLGGTSWLVLLGDPDDTKNFPKKNTAWNCNEISGRRSFHIISEWFVDGTLDCFKYTPLVIGALLKDDCRVAQQIH